MTLKFKCNNYAALVTISLISFALSACDSKPKNALAQQQHFICKSLIDGFLKAENLSQYELQNVQPIIQDAISERHYIYRVATDHQMKFNIPTQRKLHFQCQHADAQHYRVRLMNQDNQVLQPLIQLELPPKPVMRELTAFSLEQQSHSSQANK